MNTIIGLFSPAFGLYQWWQNTRGNIKIKAKSRMDIFILTFVNNGRNPILLGAGSTSCLKYGFITPKGKHISFEDSCAVGEFQHSLGMHEEFERYILMGRVNQCLVSEGFKGKVKIRFFIRDENGKVYKSAKQLFRAEDVMMSSCEISSATRRLSMAR